MAIKLGVHVQLQDGSKGYVSAILGDACEVTLRDGGGVGVVAADSLKTLKGRPRKIEVVAAAVAEACDSASV